MSTFLETACSIKHHDPVSLRRTFLFLIRNYYSDPGWFGDVAEPFKKFQYKDDNTGNIAIRLDWDEDPRSGEDSAVIYVGLGDSVISQRVLDDHEQHSPDLRDQTHVRVETLPLIVRHRSGSAEEALALGVVTQGFLISAMKQIRPVLGVLRVGEWTLTRPALVSQDHPERGYVAELRTELQFPYAWTIAEESLRVKNISFEV